MGAFLDYSKTCGNVTSEEEDRPPKEENNESCV